MQIAEEHKVLKGERQNLLRDVEKGKNERDKLENAFNDI